MTQVSKREMPVRKTIEGPKPVFYGFSLFIGRLIFKALYGVRFERDPEVKAKTGPYFIVGNHISYVDPILCALAFPDQRIRFVSGQEVANIRLLRKLLRKFAIIEIMPFRVNFSTTKEIIGSIAAGHSVALYPETQRSMAGDLTPFGLATAKLIKHLKAPVAAALCQGAYLAWPRWAAKPRLGKVEVQTRLLLTAEEAASLPVEAIQRRLVDLVNTDDYSWQTKRKRPARYWSRRRAEKLSYVCHWCPSCDRPLIMRSEKNKLFCSSCLLKLRVDAAGFFSASPGSPAPFDHPLDFARWQRDRLAETLDQGMTFESPCRLQFLENVGRGPDPDSKDRQGRLLLSDEGLIFLDQEDSRKTVLEIGDTPSLYCSPGQFVNLLEGGWVWRAWPDEEGYVALLTDYSRRVWLKNNNFDS